MKTSQKFKRALYHDQSPSISDYFELRHSSLFVTDLLQSWVDICVVDSLPRSDQADLDLDENEWSPAQPEESNQFKTETVLRKASAERTAVWTERVNRGDQVHRLVKVCFYHWGPVWERLFFCRLLMDETVCCKNYESC